MNDDFGFDGEGSKKGVQEKWQKIYVNSTKSDNIQEIITEVGKLQPSIADRKVETTINRSGVKKGRRAEKSVKAPPAPEFEPSGNDSPQPQAATDDGPPKPNRVSGWGEDAPKRRGRNLGEGFEQFEDDLATSIDDIMDDRPPPRKSTGWDSERLRPRSPEKSDESDTEIPVIPDLEEEEKDDLTQKIAYAPNVAVNRVATYRELDNDLLKQAAFLTLDNEIDLKLLTKSLSTEADLLEEDKPWDWDRLFTEVTSELLTQWEKNEQTEPNEQSTMSQI